MTCNVYYQSGNIDRAPRCFAFMFTNVGDTVANVNGMIIYPATVAGNLGDSRTISGHEGEEYKGIIRLAIDAPAGANPAIEIVQLLYVD